jgi:hypothetical protein
LAHFVFVTLEALAPSRLGVALEHPKVVGSQGSLYHPEFE